MNARGNQSRESVFKEIRRNTRRKYSTEENAGLRKPSSERVYLMKRVTALCVGILCCFGLFGCGAGVPESLGVFIDSGDGLVKIQYYAIDIRGRYSFSQASRELRAKGVDSAAYVEAIMPTVRNAHAFVVNMPDVQISIHKVFVKFNSSASLRERNMTPLDSQAKKIGDGVYRIEFQIDPGAKPWAVILKVALPAFEGYPADMMAVMYIARLEASSVTDL